MIIEDKLYQTRYNTDTTPHIRVDTSLCEDCSEMPCLFICPVQAYKLQDGKLNFQWEGCVECGACRIVCPSDAIVWSYPRGGFGVCFRYG